MKRAKKPNHAVRRNESPEEALFRNVILQAITDATMQISDRCQEIVRKQQKNIQRQAREWVQQQGRDFRAVCEFAGLDASCVYKFAMMRIKESIERENARTADFLTSAMPGVGENFQMEAQDRRANDARDGEKNRVFVIK